MSPLPERARSVVWHSNSHKKGNMQNAVVSLLALNSIFTCQHKWCLGKDMAAWGGVESFRVLYTR